MIPRRRVHPGQRGRPRLKGKRRPTLEAVLADEKTQWTTLTIDDWYGEGPREVEVATDTAVWYHAGKPPVAIRWVLIRDPQERFKPQALLSTNLAAYLRADADLVCASLDDGSDV